MCLFAGLPLCPLDLLCDEKTFALLVIHRGTLLLERCFLLLESLRTTVNPCDEPTLIRLIDVHDTGAAKMLDELGERHPARGVHV